MATWVQKKKDEAAAAANAIVVPKMPGHWDLVDKDTPEEAHTRKSLNDENEDLVLVFSDEFNADGRSFYPGKYRVFLCSSTNVDDIYAGDDPYWEAVDLHYWGTNNYEWYDPAGITTEDGALVITLSEKETHDLHYQGGLMTVR